MAWSGVWKCCAPFFSLLLISSLHTGKISCLFFPEVKLVLGVCGRAPEAAEGRRKCGPKQSPASFSTPQSLEKRFRKERGFTSYLNEGKTERRFVW